MLDNIDICDTSLSNGMISTWLVANYGGQPYTTNVGSMGDTSLTMTQARAMVCWLDGFITQVILM